MDYAAPYKGNFIRSIQSLKKQFVKNGGRLIYLFPFSAQNLDWISDLRKEEENIYFIDNSFFSKKISYKNIKLVTDIFRKERIDIIHTHFVSYNYSLFLIKTFFVRKIYIMGHFHNEFHPPRNLMRRVRIFVVKMTFDLIIGVSQSVAKSVKKSGIKAEKVTCILNAIEFNRLDIFEQISLIEKNNQKIVLMFGWPFHRKGVDIAIEAIKQLNVENNNILLAISLAGGNDLFESEILNQLGEIPPWIKIIPPRDDVATYYNACDIFLSAGREEGLNYSVIEAAYCNCAVIVSAIPGNPQDIPFSIKYEVEDVFQLKESIKGFINKPKAEINQQKIVQKEYVSRVYDLSGWVESVIKNYSLL